MGRWLSEDPAGFAAGDANLARYVGNSPTMYVDPLGLVQAFAQNGAANTTSGGILSENDEGSSAEDPPQEKGTAKTGNNIQFEGDPEDVKKVEDIWATVKDRAQGSPVQDAIEDIENGSTQVVIHIVRGKRFGLADYKEGQIDLDVLEVLISGEGPGTSQQEVLLHEVYEQWIKQKNNLGNSFEDYAQAHEKAMHLQQQLEGYETTPNSHVKTDDEGNQTTYKIIRKDGQYWIETWTFDTNGDISRIKCNEVNPDDGKYFWDEFIRDWEKKTGAIK